MYEPSLQGGCRGQIEGWGGTEGGAGDGNVSSVNRGF